MRLSPPASDRPRTIAASPTLVLLAGANGMVYWGSYGQDCGDTCTGCEDF